MRAPSLGTWLVGSMSVWAVLLGAGSASAQPEETEGTCSNYALSPSEATLSSDGGSGTLDLTWDWEAPEVEEFCIANCTNASCGEQTGSVRSSATWLTATKNGDDQVDYTVAGGYTGSSSREATLTVAGATFTVTQQPPGPCPSSPDRLSSTSLSFPAATSVRYVSVAGRSDCSWSVSGEDWITTPSSVSGGGLVRVQAAPSCSNDGQRMTDVYSRNYGNPGWEWEPSACHDRLPSGFTDQISLEPTVIRVPHVNELRDRIDQQRSFFGLAPFVWTDSMVMPWVTPVKAVHLTELRTALDEAYAAAGRGAPTYTDSEIVPGVTQVRAVHWSELRAATSALER